MIEESTLDKLKAKLHRALRHKAILQERTKMLAQQVEEARRREEQSDHVVNEVLERQRELSFMLHRANTVLHRLQEANVALSAEFQDLVKELPEPDAPGWDDRVTKINDLFKKTGALADEAETDIFGKQPPPESSSTQDEADPPGDIRAFERQADPTPTNETIDPPKPAEHITDAAFTPTRDVEADRMDRIERLFGSQPPVQTERPSVPVAPAVKQERRPGLMRRMWRKMTGQSRKNAAKSPAATSQNTDSGNSENARSSAA